MRRMPLRASARRRERSSGPTSTSIVRPLSHTRIASPCPTSSTVTVHCRTGAGPSATATEQAKAAPRKRTPLRGARGSGHHAHSTAAARAAAPASSHPPFNATAAPGSCANPLATHAVAPRTDAADCDPRLPTAGTKLPATAPASPRSIATETRGPAIRFAIGASSDTMPKPDATTGTVVNWATRVSESAAPMRRHHPVSPDVAHAPARSPNRSSPPTASAESCKPRSNTAHGPAASTATTAPASEATPSLRRPANCPIPPTRSIRSDRIAEYGRPVTTA
jgi:hypothetical protein